jgi:spore maturation protein CgeB
MGWKISDRIFKAMGCGCLFICPPMSGLYRFFIPGKHLVTYDGSVDDLKTKVKYYLEHDAEREEIAKNGQIEILRNHTITTRVIQYINAIKEICLK